MIAWEVVKGYQQIKKLKKADQSKVTFEIQDRPGVRLLELIKNCPYIFLIDAIKTGAAIGTIHQVKNEDIEHLELRLSTHSINLKDALSLARVLDCLPKEIVFYGIEVAEIKLDCQLSANVSKAKDILIMKLVDDLEKYFLQELVV
jgi:hydrogenase maturation protease